MRSVWHSLAWKEWHEHKWKLAALVMVICGVNALIVLSFYRDWRQDMFDVAYAMTVCCVVPLSLFIGASVAAGERSRGTASFLQAMPITPTTVAVFKLLAGLATLVASIVLAFAFVFVWYKCALMLGYQVTPPVLHPRYGLPQPIELSNWFVNRAILTSFVACSVYLWTTAAGVNHQDEVSAAARGALTMVVWWLTLFLVNRWFDQQWLRRDGWWIPAMCLSASPGGIGIVDIPRSQILTKTILGVSWPIAAGFVFYLGLAYWYVSRFDRAEVGGVRSPQPAQKPVSLIDWLGPPRRSPLTAIAWKQCRESGPLVMIGVAGILAVVAIVSTANWRDFSTELAMHAYYGVTYGMGLLVTLVVGIGVMLFDLGPKLNTFWRSRPINPNLWYWTKVATGLVVVFTSLYLPLAIVALLERGTIFMQASAYEVVLFPAITIGIYISAVTMTCLVRHAIYAAILSIAALYVGPLLLQSAKITANWLFGADYVNTLWLVRHANVTLAATMSTIAVAMLIAGWLAVRNDWGRKTRY